MRTAKIQLSYAVLDEFTGAFRDALNYAEDLNKALNDIRIVTYSSKEDMADFAVQANKAAKAIGTTTVAYAEAALIYYQQGLSDEEVTERANVTTKLANVTGDTTETVSSQLTAIWNNFYDGSKSLEYYADALAALGAATASSTDEIADGLQQFASVAETVGLSFDTASAALATVVANTRKSADEVGNSFKTIFARLQSLNLGETLDDDTTLTKYTEALSTVGVNIIEQNGELKAMDDILDELGDKWANLTDQQKVATAYTVAGARQYSNFIALMDDWDEVEANISVAQGSEGTLETQNEIYKESWEGATNQLQAALETLYGAIIDDEVIINFINALTTAVEKLNSFINAVGGVGPIITGIGVILRQVFSASISKNIKSILTMFRTGIYSKNGGESEIVKNIAATEKLTQQLGKSATLWQRTSNSFTQSIKTLFSKTLDIKEAGTRTSDMSLKNVYSLLEKMSIKQLTKETSLQELQANRANALNWASDENGNIRNQGVYNYIDALDKNLEKLESLDGRSSEAKSLKKQMAKSLDLAEDASIEEVKTAAKKAISTFDREAIFALENTKATAEEMSNLRQKFKEGTALQEESNTVKKENTAAEEEQTQKIKESTAEEFKIDGSTADERIAQRAQIPDKIADLYNNSAEDAAALEKMQPAGTEGLDKTDETQKKIEKTIALATQLTNIISSSSSIYETWINPDATL